METVRFGLAIRALRMKASWTQEELGAASQLSASAISRVERSRADRLSVAALERVVAALGARMRVELLWQGEELARLLDRRHATLVEYVVTLLRAAAWEVAVEVTFAQWGERGSIDILAWHAATRSLLVIEVKSVVPDVQAMLASLDRKVRIAPELQRVREWGTPATVSRLLVLPSERTARRRVAAFAATFDAAFPARTVAARHWIGVPTGPLAGILFVANVTDAATRHRVSRKRRTSTRGDAASS